jgi:signal transduction histidine kinase
VDARRSEGAPGAGVEIRVHDRGRGIPAEVLPRIFDPFFTTKPLGQGTGLGLAIANRIVASHGGHLEVDSVVGRGTVVAMWLPADPAALEPSSPGVIA